MASNRPIPRPFTALGRISTPMRPPEEGQTEETGKRPKIPSAPPPNPRASTKRPIDRIAAQIESRRSTTPPIEGNYSVEWEDDEKTPVNNPYRVIDGKIVDVGDALPSTPPPSEETAPPTIPETPSAILAKMPLPPRPVLNVTWVENRGTRIRNGISFFLLACFIVVMIAGATWAFLWNGRNHQQLIQHQREEQEKEDRYR